MFGNILCNFLLRYRNYLLYQNATDSNTFYIAENKRKLFWLHRKLTLICIFILIFQKILKFHMILYMLLWFLKVRNYLICSNMQRYFAWFKIHYLAKYVYTIWEGIVLRKIGFNCLILRYAWCVCRVLWYYWLTALLTECLFVAAMLKLYYYSPNLLYKIEDSCWKIVSYDKKIILKRQYFLPYVQFLFCKRYWIYTYFMLKYYINVH